MTSRYIPPGPDGLLGARKMAVAEWKTDTFESHMNGHMVSRRTSGASCDEGLSW